MTDYKQLCADLVAWAEKTSAHYYSEPRVLIRARAALAEPEPEPPTDEGIMALMPQQMRDDLAAAARAMAGFDPDNIKAASIFRIILNRHCVDHVRAILARWGNHPGSPDSSMPQPVPVSERLPGPEDCIANPRNGQGQWCWGWCVDDSAVPFSGRWRMICRQWLADEAVAWLPAHALPVPF